mmetsp:Transcript_13482/g.40147  ORF Transcript_13482/g.40147 Transcript_13482/m.40147 type:complete len:318 (+) Transcript_13482:20-973(+)
MWPGRISSTPGGGRAPRLADQTTSASATRPTHASATMSGSSPRRRDGPAQRGRDRVERDGPQVADDAARGERQLQIRRVARPHDRDQLPRRGEARVVQDRRDARLVGPRGGVGRQRRVAVVARELAVLGVALERPRRVAHGEALRLAEVPVRLVLRGQVRVVALHRDLDGAPQHGIRQRGGRDDGARQRRRDLGAVSDVPLPGGPFVRLAVGREDGINQDVVRDGADERLHEFLAAGRGPLRGRRRRGRRLGLALGPARRVLLDARHGETGPVVAERRGGLFNAQPSLLQAPALQGRAVKRQRVRFVSRAPGVSKAF